MESRLPGQTRPHNGTPSIPGPELERQRANGRPRRPQQRVPKTDSRPEATAAQGLEIAEAIAGAYKDALGSGPSRVTVHFAPPATLVVVLEDTMTVEERTLAALGEDARLRQDRLVVTGALEDRFRSIVERALGRRTVAFLSGIDTRRDVAVDVFTLESEATDAQPGASVSTEPRAQSPRPGRAGRA